MVSFEKTKASDWGIMKASTEEWHAIKSLMNHVAQPEIFHASELDIMSSGLKHEDWLCWNRKFSQDKYRDDPPKLIHRSELQVLFSTAIDAIDAQVQGLTPNHYRIIEEICKHSMSDAVDCGNAE